MNAEHPASRGPQIRAATAGDCENLAALKLDTFRETFLRGFGIPYPADDLARFEAETYSPTRIMAELRDPAHRTWVAEDEGRLVAYAHLGPCKLPHPEASSSDVELYQIYLRQEAQGAGLGKRLLDLALDPTQSGCPAAQWLGVWSGNCKAQQFYERHGFAKAGEYKYRVGNWFDDEFIYRRVEARKS